MEPDQAPQALPQQITAATPTDVDDSKAGLVLEGWLLKQGSRVQFWHERHFRFTTDHRLEYAKSTIAPAKAVLHLPELSDLQVSDLYVTKHKQVEVYCVKLTWTTHNVSFSNLNPMLLETFEEDDSSVSVSMSRDASGRPLQQDYHQDVFSGVSESVAATPGDRGVSESPRRRGHHQYRRSPLVLFRRKSKSSSEVRSVDRESITLGSRRRRRGSKRDSSSPDATTDDDDVFVFHGDGAGVPSEVQVDPHHSLSSLIMDSPVRRPSHIRKFSIGSANNNNKNYNNNNINSPAPPPPPPPPPPISTPPPTMRRHTLSTTPYHNSASFPNANANANANNAEPQQQQIRLRTAYERQREEELQFMWSQYWTTKAAKKKKVRQRLSNGTKIVAATGAAIGLTVVTAGIGLVAGLVVLGAAAAGGGSAAVGASWRWRKKVRGELVLASPDYETIRMWKACLDASKNSDCIKKSTWGQLFVSDGRRTSSALLPRALAFAKENKQDSQRSERSTLKIGEQAKWIPLEGGWMSLLGCGQGLRVFREHTDCDGCTASAAATTPAVNSSNLIRRLLQQDSEGSPCVPMKAHVVLNTSPLDAFLCLMAFGRVLSHSPLGPNMEHSSSFRIIESVDDHTDIIHLVFRPLYLLPTWTTPRDFCLFRYWRVEQDGSYVVCYESVLHPKCPPTSSSLYVRGEMHQVITIAPQKQSYRRRGTSPPPPMDCLMTAVVQVDPKGWVPTRQTPFLSNQGYGDAFAVAALAHLLEIRDAIDLDRFVPVFLDGGGPPDLSVSPSFKKTVSLSRKDSLDEGLAEEPDDTPNYDYNYADRESKRLVYSGAELDLALNPPPLALDKWAEPDGNSFMVRGPTYKLDHLKINAGESIGQLVAADVIWSEEPIYSGFSVHPGERLQLALQREQQLKSNGRKSDMPPFLFIVTIVLPGPPYYYGVYYFAVHDMSTIDGSDGTPSSRLCKEFFFGDSDEFRDRTFKMIPQIVQGNFIVRKAVGDTPAIMGTKLRQLYVKGDRFFEVILDCGSSSVATGVIKLSLSYTKMLVVDMGFLFEGDDPTTLPERMFGAVRMKQIDFGPHLRKVEPPPS